VTGEMLSEEFLWGWFRLVLGSLQMSLALLALLALITNGPDRLTLSLAIAATAATLFSRVLYHGHRTPKL
jgi:hypothetical protein